MEEAFPKDQGRALARICPSFLRDWGIKVGDVLELQPCNRQGQKVGVIVIPSETQDQGVTIVRLDRITRKNLQVSLGELVRIRSVARQFARMVAIAPAEAQIRLLVRPTLLRSRMINHPVVQGEILTITGKVRKILPKEFQDRLFSPPQMGLIKIQVMATDPTGIVVVGSETEIRIQTEVAPS